MTSPRQEARFQPSKVGIARAQCAIYADQYRTMEEGRVPGNTLAREAQNIRRGIPVQSFLLDSTPEQSPRRD